MFSTGNVTLTNLHKGVRLRPGTVIELLSEAGADYITDFVPGSAYRIAGEKFGLAELGHIAEGELLLVLDSVEKDSTARDSDLVPQFAFVVLRARDCCVDLVDDGMMYAIVFEPQGD